METEEKTFKILCIDGGGIKGLYSATILQHLEEQFDCCISDRFDMLCGTSTGGLIALALSLRIPAAEIVQFYREEGANIFPQYTKSRWIHRFISGFKQITWNGKFSDEPLKKALQKVFGEKVLGQSENLLCIPSYTITDARPWIFKFDHTEGKLNRDNGIRYVDVALATSAAPTYFPVAENPDYHNKQFIDGGVWANNPTLVGFLEALTYFVGKDKEFKKLSILSVSSLTLTGGTRTGKKRNRSFFGWRDSLFETSMTGQSHFTDHFMTKMNEVNDVDVNYLRIPSPDISHEQAGQVQLDVATENALDLLAGKGDDQGQRFRKDPRIAEFFAHPKHYKTH
ncbi:CBASS cGAMP-activated phospholipase [Hymenobacter mucosus]|uniref:Patatin-like phospholipase/acyl hydrolase n=1 Tax=Hymenobacter mucosus TaxID=1411120 RepID=A0A238ZXF3_9BACT|nr:CBASS cGAMP-activated phospholipase [Hymenobacter mucosus]SNR88000.1 Patatin-like phospholipase/acyl hydrolase [Hymenobacter mucosus]